MSVDELVELLQSLPPEAHGLPVEVLVRDVERTIHQVSIETITRRGESSAYVLIWGDEP